MGSQLIHHPLCWSVSPPHEPFPFIRDKCTSVLHHPLQIIHSDGLMEKLLTLCQFDCIQTLLASKHSPQTTIQMHANSPCRALLKKQLLLQACCWEINYIAAIFQRGGGKDAGSPGRCGDARSRLSSEHQLRSRRAPQWYLCSPGKEDTTLDHPVWQSACKTEGGKKIEKKKGGRSRGVSLCIAPLLDDTHWGEEN